MKVKLPFVGPAYQARSLNADAQRAVNCYLEMDNASPRAPVALYGTPGTVRKFTLPTFPVRECIQEDQYSYWVAGNTVYRVKADYSFTALGTIATGSGPVSMASNGAQILLVDGVSGWLINVAANTLTEIADGDFPKGVKRTAYQDGYFIVTGNNSQAFYINQTPYDGTQWDALDFASAEGSPDDTIGVISDHRELWFFGSNSAEVWVNTGAADFPFQRSGNTFIEHGCASAGTVAKADNTVFWLGSDDRGSGIVWRADGYTPVRISTHALEKAIDSYSVISDSFAFTYQQEGHIFYVLTFPTAAKTWVYDAATQQWHERAWRDPVTNTLTRWRANCSCFFNGEHLVGDYKDGRVYALDLDAYTDDGDPIKRIRATTATENLQNRIFVAMLQVDMETGVGLSGSMIAETSYLMTQSDDYLITESSEHLIEEQKTAITQGSAPLLMLRYSGDGGHTWSNENTATVGKVGQYGARARFNRLGVGRNRVWEISMTDPVKWAVFGAVVEGQEGSD